MRTPNSEQRIAIEHNGGVLLNAGAGSGKTFVLVEHIYFLVQEFLSKNNSKNDLQFEKELKIYLGKIVLMTFTNDAAGEIRNRVFERFENANELSGDKKIKAIVQRSLSALTITTIHGFCMKLIKQGYIPAPTNFILMDEIQMKKKISDLCEKWFEECEDQILLKNKSQIINAMNAIFSSPELRVDWIQSEKKDNFNEESYLESIFDLIGISDFWNKKFDLGPYTDFSDKSWFKLISGFNNLKDKKLTINTLFEALEIFKSSGRLVISKKISDEVRVEVESAKELKAFALKNADDLGVYANNKEQFMNWKSFLVSLFWHVEKNYYKSEGISFSDLEYLVYRALESDDVVDVISKAYEYFIVDEYQDTSFIQYEILKKMMKDDHEKLFCVGDRKQAIYGFRGGELGVFDQTEQNITKNLLLKNNYRSEEEIVTFNNDFFTKIFALGRSYEGVDKFSVVVDKQAFPDGKTAAQGQIVCHRLELQNESSSKKLSSKDYSKFEAKEFVEIIKHSKDGEEVCVLYRNLKPSKELINLLIKEGIAFEAQVKIPYGEDPLIIIFKALIDFLVEKNRLSKDSKESLKIEEYTLFYIHGVLKHFSLFDEVSADELTKFQEAISFEGLFLSFVKFNLHLGITNSSYQNNLKKIQEICDMCLDDINEIWTFLKSLDDRSYSTKFNYLTKPKVYIMTAHASKGLQYDTVLLGGIHNNGRKIVNLSTMGKMPSSFKWTPDRKRKKLYKSPAFILEGLINDFKEFSESKRLLYVACTRAEREIHWVDLRLDSKEQSDGKESWINGLRVFSSESLKENAKSTIYEDEDSTLANPPLFFRDNLGLGVKSNGLDFSLVSELSVTKFATIALCPRKFYFDQILKLSEDVEKFYEINQVEVNKRIGTSDAKRGTRVHLEIERLITGGETSAEYSDILGWVQSQLDTYSQTKFISEKEMKFSLFGQMITGVPDLYLMKNEELIEIWDFKTGICNEDDQTIYFCQLLTYLYGLVQSGIKTSKEVDLKILLLDEKKIVSKLIPLEEVSHRLFEIWSKISDYSVKEIPYCKTCLYGNLCHP